MLPIKINKLDVLNSWSLLIPEAGDVSFDLSYLHEDIKVIFVIKHDSGKAQNTDLVLENEATMRITLTNWGRNLATTLQQAIRVGTIGGRVLYFMFSVTQLGDESNVNHLTFTTYLGDEVDNGKA